MVAQLGEMLRAARKEKNLSLEQVEDAIHIRRHLLVALEEDNLDQFPSPVVTRGMIRNYANFLGLDPIAALTLYDGNGVVPVKGQRLTPDGIEFMDLSMSSGRFVNWELIIGVLFFMLVIGAGGYLIYEAVAQPPETAATPLATFAAEGNTEDTALLLPTVTPVPTDTPTPLPPTATATPLIYTGVNIDLVIRQSSWVQILSDDVKVFEGILQPNTTRSWSGQKRVAIRAGNGGGVEVIVNGTSRGLMGAEGQVVDQIWEKVDNPSALPTEPGPDEEPTATATAADTGAVNGDLPLPLESAPSTTPEG
jgi:cytoskeletal protein RodZ